MLFSTPGDLVDGGLRIIFHFSAQPILINKLKNEFKLHITMNSNLFITILNLLLTPRIPELIIYYLNLNFWGVTVLFKLVSST